MRLAKASRRRETGVHPRIREGMLFGIMLYLVFRRTGKKEDPGTGEAQGLSPDG
jgi:hypothetical protein